MKRHVTTFLAVIAALALASPLAADEKPASKAGKAAKSSSAKGGGGKATLVPVDKLEWKDAPNGPAGVKTAVLWGDPAKGAHAAMMKLPAGAAAPLHHHTADHGVTVVSGTVVLTPEGESEVRLPAGSAFRFTGKKRHTTSCEAGADCVLAVSANGPWDLVLEEKK